MVKRSASPLSPLHFPILALAVLALLAGVWAGWVRIGWRFPPLQPALPISHGPLMVSGFLGTLIALERAVALRKLWAFLGPLLSGLGALLMVVHIPGLPTVLPPLLLSLGSLWLVAIFAEIVRRHLAFYTLAMAVGALAWLVGNLLWLSGRPIYQVVLWWAAFLVLTIAGERLELGRLLRFTRLVELLFAGAALTFLAGLLLIAVQPGMIQAGTRVASIGMILLSAWLLRFDIARKTIHASGLPRYAAVCLLAGYAWLGISGLLALAWGATAAGPRYDAVLHAVFVGFVFSMIFGHAPIIFPAVLGLPVKFHPVFYGHLGLLHLSLILRVAGDILGSAQARMYGGLLNGIAILLFLATTALVVVKE